MTGEFCRTVTADGLELQGFLVLPEGGIGRIGLIHVHGLAGNFYENRFVDNIGEAVAGAQVSFLTVNTRGHDYISDFIYGNPDGTEEYKQIGGIYEMFEDCIEDIAAWVGFLKSRGVRRIILQGHSHGALKVAHYVHKVETPEIAGLILLSPSDDFGRQRSRLGGRFGEALAVAGDMVAGGKTRDLMPAQYFHYPVSAGSYLDIFRADSPLKMFNLSRTDSEDFTGIASISVPVLAIVGSVEEEFIGESEEYLSQIEAEAKSTPGFTGHIIRGAPHNYLGFETQVARRIGEWLGSAPWT